MSQTQISAVADASSLSMCETCCITSTSCCRCFTLPPCLSARCTSERMYIIIPPLNNEIKVLFIFKWWYLLQRLFTFIAIWMFLCEVPGWRPCLQALIAPRPPRVVSPITPSSLSLSDASLADSVLTCLGRNAPNAVLCSSSLTMKGAIILQHKYFIPHLDADLRCHTVNTNGLSLPWKITEALCEYDLCEL